MSSGVISATDYFERRRLGPLAFEALVREREQARSRSHLSLDEELAIRTARVEELRRGVLWRNPGPPAPPPPAKTEPAWSRTAKKKPTYPWTVTLKRNARPGFEVHLSEGVCRSMIDSFSAAAPYRVETGGFLFGNQPLNSFGGSVCHASHPAPNAKHGSTTVSLGSEAAIRDELGLDQEYFRRVGCWHSHPTEDPTPSTADMDAWAQYLWARAGERHFEYVAIIVTPGSGGLGPEFHGWVTHGARGRFVCEPAALSDRSGYCS